MSTSIALAPPTHMDLHLPNDLRLHTVQAGREDGAAVLMLHGVTDSSFSFSRILPLMPPALRLIAIDQRGHGDSDRPLTGYRIDDLADDALQVLDALGIGRATIVGHSMGSFVARGVAERAPARVEALVLIGAGHSGRNQGILDLLEACATLPDPVDEAFIREFQASTISRPVPPAFFEQVVAESRKVPPYVWRQAIEGLVEFESRRPITCPTRILGGDGDAVFSVREQAALAASIAGSTLHIEHGIGHTLHWEAPERFVSLAFSAELRTT